ncbi:hypothetical protein [Lelliottia amnigena]|uniref:hypothetical protein n=1 Tax=Lelliottia amnigena TaxID=61646 RepID=UPI003B9E505B
MPNIILSEEDLASFTKTTRNEIAAFIHNQLFQDEEIENSDGVAIDLSSSQASELINKISKKSLSVLRAMLNEGEDGFYFDDIAEAIGENEDDLRGVFSGLTRRVRNVTGQPKAELFDKWVDYDDNDRRWGQMNLVTYNNLKRIMKI